MEIDYEKEQYSFKIKSIITNLKSGDYASFPPEKYAYLKQIVYKENLRLRKEGLLRPVERRYSLSMLKGGKAIVFLTKDGKPY